MGGQAYLILDRRILSLLPTDIPDCQQIPCRVLVPAGWTVRQAVENLGIRLPAAVIPLVNERTEDLSYRLQADDQVRLLIQLSGGYL